jgi:hypothetical protein
MTLLVDVHEAIEKQLPAGVFQLLTITVYSDPYFIAPRVTFTPKRKPEMVIEAKLDHDFGIPREAIAAICLWA